jgi:hypothetical protein
MFIALMATCFLLVVWLSAAQARDPWSGHGGRGAVMTGHGPERSIGQSAYASGPTIMTKNPTVGKRGLYIIQDEDTLWDLCDLFFGEPWYWPKLWSYNPQLTNPHWIFPGDIIQVREPQPPSRTTIVWSESRYTQRKVDLEILARYVGYLPQRAFEESGQITFARETRETLGEYDEVYIEFAVDTEVKKGQKFTIYRYEKELEHPETDDLVGHKIRHLGVLKVLDADQRFVKALIVRSYEEIYRDDLVTSIFPHDWVVGPVVNKVELESTIVDFHSPGKYVGQYQYVYLDKGRNDGLKRGNRFIIRRRGDGTWDEDPEDDDFPITDFPWEYLGEVMVVEAFESSSLGIVSRTILELEVGEVLYMPKDY